MPVPQVFISATSRDLGSFREAVSDVLLTLGAPRHSRALHARLSLGRRDAPGEDRPVQCGHLPGRTPLWG